MTPTESFKTWKPDTLVPSHEEAYVAGWKACAAFYDGKSCIHFSPPGTKIDAIVGIPMPDKLDAEEIWAMWPVKKARGAAIPAIQKAIKKAGREVIAQAVADYARAFATWPAQDRQFLPMCSTWMNQQRWLDDRATWYRGTPTTQAIKTRN